MKTHYARIRSITIVQVKEIAPAPALSVTLLLDTGLLLRMTLSTLLRWGDELTLGSAIAYDVDDAGGYSNPRPIETTSCPVCGTLQVRGQLCQVCVEAERQSVTA